ncbi:N-acetyltransferase family protein [Albidovulum sp.]|uniref:GNAT family N-acetyltransferase n=1 Tax=Albidovulum sp. TaxID=1872424 RepID=UPI0039B8A5D2
MAGTDILIRPIGAADESDWRRLWRAYLAFYETELPEAVYAATFARLTSGRSNEYRGLLAIQEGRPVGLAHYLFHRSCWSIEDTCYLQDLFADPGVRGTGIGRRLIEAVYAAADAHGAGLVYWTTQEFNHAARRLYDRIGVKTPFIEYNRA